MMVLWSTLPDVHANVYKPRDRKYLVFTCWDSSASAAPSSCDLSPEEFLLAEAFLFLPDDSKHTQTVKD